MFLLCRVAKLLRFLELTMVLPALLLFAALAEALPQGGGGGSTMLRFGCAQAVIDRIDPLVNPGLAPSPHMHQVVGGNAFNTSMADTDISSIASCTTCGYSDDFSNYWTANMYFKARNGSYKRVPQVPNRYFVMSPSYMSKMSAYDSFIEISSVISTQGRPRVALLCIMSLRARARSKLLSL